MHQEPNSQLKMADKVYKLSNLAKKIEAKEFSKVVLRESIFDLIYILERIEGLRANFKADLSSVDRNEAEKVRRSMQLIRFYSQCLLLWSFRILEILSETSGLEIPLDIRIARNILAAHYGIAKGKLTRKLNRKRGFVMSPKISANGNLTYNLGPLGGPASAASSSEVQIIKQLYGKYCPEEPEPNAWEICRKILRRDDVKIIKKDLDKIRHFIRDHGGVITDSDRIIDFVIDSLEKSYAKSYDK